MLVGKCARSFNVTINNNDDDFRDYSRTAIQQRSGGAWLGPGASGSARNLLDALALFSRFSAPISRLIARLASAFGLQSPSALYAVRRFWDFFAVT